MTSKKAGITQVIQRLDNETSQEIIEAIEENNYNINLHHPAITKHYQQNKPYKFSKIISFRFCMVSMIVT